MKNSLQKALEHFAYNVDNDVANFNLGIEYHKIGNSAGAISFLLRAAEITNDDDLAYESLLVNALNFRKQGKRSGSYRNQILHAIAICPERPEAYFILSRYYNEHKQHHEAVSFAKIGLSKPTANKVNELLEYYGSYVLEAELAIGYWWIGSRDKSRNLFKHLLKEVDMVDIYKDLCITNLKNVGAYNELDYI